MFYNKYGKKQSPDKESIKRCLELLSEEQRMVVLAYYYDNMSIKGIAELFEVSESNVKNRLYLARKRLMDILEDEEDKQKYKSFIFCIPVLIEALNDIMETDVEITEAQMKGIEKCFARNVVLK